MEQASIRDVQHSLLGEAASTMVLESSSMFVPMPFTVVLNSWAQQSLSQLRTYYQENASDYPEGAPFPTVFELGELLLAVRFPDGLLHGYHIVDADTGQPTFKNTSLGTEWFWTDIPDDADDEDAASDRPTIVTGTYAMEVVAPANVTLAFTKEKYRTGTYSEMRMGRWLPVLSDYTHRMAIDQAEVMVSGDLVIQANEFFMLATVQKDLNGRAGRRVLYVELIPMLRVPFLWTEWVPLFTTDDIRHGFPLQLVSMRGLWQFDSILYEQLPAVLPEGELPIAGYAHAVKQEGRLPIARCTEAVAALDSSLLLFVEYDHHLAVCTADGQTYPCEVAYAPPRATQLRRDGVLLVARDCVLLPYDAGPGPRRADRAGDMVVMAPCGKSPDRYRCGPLFQVTHQGGRAMKQLVSSCRSVDAGAPLCVLQNRVRDGHWKAPLENDALPDWTDSPVRRRLYPATNRSGFGTWVEKQSMTGTLWTVVHPRTMAARWLRGVRRAFAIARSEEQDGPLPVPIPIPAPVSMSSKRGQTAESLDELEAVEDAKVEFEFGWPDDALVQLQGGGAVHHVPWRILRRYPHFVASVEWAKRAGAEAEWVLPEEKHDHRTGPEAPPMTIRVDLSHYAECGHGLAMMVRWMETGRLFAGSSPAIEPPQADMDELARMLERMRLHGTADADDSDGGGSGDEDGWEEPTSNVAWTAAMFTIRACVERRRSVHPDGLRGTRPTRSEASSLPRNFLLQIDAALALGDMCVMPVEYYGACLHALLQYARTRPEARCRALELLYTERLYWNALTPCFPLDGPDMRLFVAVYVFDGQLDSEPAQLFLQAARRPDRVRPSTFLLLGVEYGLPMEAVWCAYHGWFRTVQDDIKDETERRQIQGIMSHVGMYAVSHPDQLLSERSLSQLQSQLLDPRSFAALPPPLPDGLP